MIENKGEGNCFYIVLNTNINNNNIWEENKNNINIESNKYKEILTTFCKKSFCIYPKINRARNDETKLD